MKKPNILVLFCDQLRRHALSMYGETNLATPNIDSLAANGVAFRNACATYPICVPFRFTLMTGEYAHSRYVPGIEYRMSPAERTLADEFNDAGYETYYIGKWHLFGGHGRGRFSLPGTVPVPREHQGRWKHWRGFDIHNIAYDWCYFVDDDPTPRHTGKHQTDGLFDIALEDLAKHPKDGKPFAMVLSIEAPHLPMDATPEYAAKWRNRELTLPPNFSAPDNERQQWIDDRRTYYALTEHVDYSVGRLMEFLRKSGLADNTIVVFFADHGELSGSHGTTIIDFLGERAKDASFWSIRQKQHPYEESVGIPLIISDPACRATHGRMLSDPTCTEDLFPTLLGLAGLTPRNKLPGMNLAPLIRGQTEKLPRDGVLLEYVLELRHKQVFYDKLWRAFRTERYKYIVLGDNRGAEPWLFFDLKNDPYELRNLVNDPAYADEIARHHRLLRERMIATGDHYSLKAAHGCDAWR
jgi:arylsulfatase A-like enzyme